MKVPQPRFVGNPSPFQFQYSANEILSQFRMSADPFLGSKLNWNPRAGSRHPWPISLGRFKRSFQLPPRFGLGISRTPQSPIDNKSQVSVLLQTSATVGRIDIP